MRSSRHAALLPLLAIAACGGGDGAPQPAVPAAPQPPMELVVGTTTTPRDDLNIRTNGVLELGTHHVVDVAGDGAIVVRGAGARLDLGKTTLVGHAAGDGRDPDAYEGIGILVVDSPGAVISGGTIRGFKVAIAVRNSPGAVIEDVDVSGNFRQRLYSTVEKEDLRDWLRPHENDANEWETKYGAGISVVDSKGAIVRRCRARNGQNGLLVTRSNEAQAYDNDFSFLSGWGIALYRTSGAAICRNRLDWCVRGYSHGVYDRGQDSSGLLVFEQCSGNTFALNSATHGGDGFFLYAGEDTLRKTGRGGSNGNVLYKNDFSHAVANAIEATFSVGNFLIENQLNDSRHGVWAGYSSETQITGNAIRDCDHGISIEHGVENKIEGNEITGCGDGVHLWWDEDPGLAETEFGRTRDIRSRQNRIGPWNTLAGNRVDIWLQHDQSGRIVGNQFDGSPPRVRLEGSCAGLLFEGNLAPNGQLLIEARHEGRVRFAGTESGFQEPRIEGDGKVDVDPDDLDRVIHWSHPPDDDSPVVVSSLPGVQDPFLADDALRGRRYILVDEWGPVDPRETRVFPARVEAGGEAVLSVLGAEGRFAVTDLTEGFVADPPEGDLPAVVRIRPKAGTPGGIHSFDVTVEAAGGTHRATGTLFSTEWDVRFFEWKTDPREDPVAWSELVAGAPLHRTTTRDLHFVWQGAAPHADLPADGFATVATTTLEFPAGSYTLTTISDDGIRVRVDGEVVIEDWTHHAPTEHTKTLDLAQGRHTIDVEHFELDGWAALTVRLRRD